MSTTIYYHPESEIVRLHIFNLGDHTALTVINVMRIILIMLKLLDNLHNVLGKWIRYIGSIGECLWDIGLTGNDLPWWYVFRSKTYHITLVHVLHRPQCTYIVNTYSPLKGVHWLKRYVKGIKNPNIFDVFTPELLTGYTEQLPHLAEGPKVFI